MKPILKHLVIGGGAAGFFGALSCVHHFPNDEIFILEKTRQLLSKVKISGGGRCNVTHACFDPAMLVKNYPRGHQELRSIFSRFQPRDTIEWFEGRGVPLKVEEDGRMFPASDNSESIVNCLLNETKKQGISVLIEHGVETIERNSNGVYIVSLSNGRQLFCDRLLIATGGASKIYSQLEKLGHSIVPLVPSLFTFNLPESPFLDLSGISLTNVYIQLPRFDMKGKGAILFTHWGLSGPAILKLSAWAARELHSVDYQTEVVINWVPEMTEEALRAHLLIKKKENSSRLIANEPLFLLPKQLWKRLTQLAGCSEEVRWAALSSKELQQLIQHLRSTRLMLRGKTTYKQEFVTCGGVALNEVNFKTMESRCSPGLFFAGEVLNIDGVTGGFNFQNAWSTAWIAGQSMGN